MTKFRKRFVLLGSKTVFSHNPPMLIYVLLRDYVRDWGY